jgi:peptidoglycan/xylan/chitin deacetylase (PgdA/CDA1 family)
MTPYPIALGFHDVVESLSSARPIAPGHTTNYTVDLRRFREHLSAVRSGVGHRAVCTADYVDYYRSPVLLTIDDGALSSYTRIAPALEELGWRGHFFITVNWIGTDGFLDEAQIKDLHQRGHLIGSHSCSHPSRMSTLRRCELLREWRNSCMRLQDIVGGPITVASVPGGYYSREVAVTAAECGIRVLFNSTPTVASTFVSGCRILGRYTVRGNTSVSEVGDIAADHAWPRWKQSAIWSAKQAAKRMAGPWYLTLRQVLAARSAQS